jgi:phenylpropionate dioxygenase-like ring-hydroxylating dioxygenase large terminal subunit
MIRNQWYAILESNEVKVGNLLGVTRMGEKLVLWRLRDGKVVCMRDTCPHLGAKLSQGKCAGEHIVCPFHGFQYDSSGLCRLLPAYGQDGKIPQALKVKTYPTCEAHDFIYLWWGENPPERLEPPRFFEAVANNANLSYASFRQHWNVHYSRMCENQLDVMHLPFVHHNTI